MIRISAFIWAGVWFFADLMTKTWALKALQNGTIEVNGFLNWRLAFNHGSAFSFLANQGGWQKYFLIAIAFLMVGYLLYLIFTELLDWGSAFAYGSIIGGALGNVYDRFVYGYVIDFIDFHWDNAHYPTFNIADVGIFCGVVTLLIFSGVKK